MRSETKTFFLYILAISAMLASFGQVLFKIGLNSTANTTLLVVFLVCGMLLYGLSAALYLFVLSRAHLSWVYSFGGLSYLFTSVLAVFLLGEPSNLVRWLGVVVIVVGCVLIGLS